MFYFFHIDFLNCTFLCCKNFENNSAILKQFIQLIVIILLHHRLTKRNLVSLRVCLYLKVNHDYFCGLSKETSGAKEKAYTKPFLKNRNMLKYSSIRLAMCNINHDLILILISSIIINKDVK